MTKLEQKLIELGYKPFYQSVYYDSFQKRLEVGNCNIIFDIKSQKITTSYFAPMSIYTQQDLDNLQQAFNEMQRDLEVLKNVED